jgi:hypothetical protein
VGLTRREHCVIGGAEVQYVAIRVGEPDGPYLAPIEATPSSDSAPSKSKGHAWGAMRNVLQSRLIASRQAEWVLPSN